MVDHESMAQELNAVLESVLNDRETTIIRECFGIGCNEMGLEEIATQLGLTRERVRQINDGDPVEKHNLRPGDLVFFNGRAVGKRIGHVGIVTEVDSAEGKFKFIHASNSRGVTVSTSEEPYYKRRYVGACRPTK